jgi:threonine dehydrogenase-like Zn-dependent dehydrogenase
MGGRKHRQGRTLGIIGVYPPSDQSFPIGQAMNKNPSINAGNCNHRAYLPHLVEMVRMGRKTTRCGCCPRSSR